MSKVIRTYSDIINISNPSDPNAGWIDLKRKLAGHVPTYIRLIPDKDCRFFYWNEEEKLDKELYEEWKAGEPLVIHEENISKIRIIPKSYPCKVSIYASAGKSGITIEGKSFLYGRDKITNKTVPISVSAEGVFSIKEIGTYNDYTFSEPILPDKRYVVDSSPITGYQVMKLGDYATDLGQLPFLARWVNKYLFGIYDIPNGHIFGRYRLPDNTAYKYTNYQKSIGYAGTFYSGADVLHKYYYFGYDTPTGAKAYKYDVLTDTVEDITATLGWEGYENIPVTRGLHIRKYQNVSRPFIWQGGGSAGNSRLIAVNPYDDTVTDETDRFNMNDTIIEIEYSQSMHKMAVGDISGGLKVYDFREQKLYDLTDKFGFGFIGGSAFYPERNELVVSGVVGPPDGKPYTVKSYSFSTGQIKTLVEDTYWAVPAYGDGIVVLPGDGWSIFIYDGVRLQKIDIPRFGTNWSTFLFEAIYGITYAAGMFILTFGGGGLVCFGKRKTIYRHRIKRKIFDRWKGTVDAGGSHTIEMESSNGWSRLTGGIFNPAGNPDLQLIIYQGDIFDLDGGIPDYVPLLENFISVPNGDFTDIDLEIKMPYVWGQIQNPDWINSADGIYSSLYLWRDKHG